MSSCKGKTRTGQPCGMAAIKGGRYCFAHSPAAGSKRAQARKEGGKARHTPHFGNLADLPAQVESPADAKKILAYALAELAGMDNSLQRVRALIAIFEAYNKSMEIGRHEELIQLIEAVMVEKGLMDAKP